MAAAIGRLIEPNMKRIVVPLLPNWIQYGDDKTNE
jgi:hypothetical protein